jgi:hypothetical protein
VVKSLAMPAGVVSGVRLLGYRGQLDWRQTAQGLVVALPARRVSAYTAALRITGAKLKPVAVPVPPTVEPKQPAAKRQPAAKK